MLELRAAAIYRWRFVAELRLEHAKGLSGRRRNCG